ncbi:NYN domain-containing protein [Caballeronia sp. BR00000012568055]|uniref:NYN domain-containing protein n=1 Tax=Caballeronia sp. BR00000012568055 TaxID=2918761 RepID=UPI0023FA2E0F|nr:NYN domain-containing protein [Caballeronia sp. BR00000012568055]
MPHTVRQLTKIGVFYDGNYFATVSRFYKYQHDAQAWISIRGLHEFIRCRVAKAERLDYHNCQIIDAHYFRGRFSAQQCVEKGENLLYHERVLDDILMRANVTAHHLPMNAMGKEKGIDVWLALEAFELSIYKHFDVVVLVAGDSDYIPLARKLKTLGIRVMVLGWSISYEINGEPRGTTPSQMLLKEVSYPILMSDVIDGIDTADSDDEKEAVRGLFPPRPDQPQRADEEPSWKSGAIVKLKKGFGFINPGNLFFFYGALIDADFDDLHEGMPVTFQAGIGSKGQPAALKVKTEPDVPPQ